jgi:methyl-accepting chemotaxis protein
VTLSAWIILFALAFFVGRSIIRPLNKAIYIARHVADGDLTSSIEVKTKDETGLLLQALKDMNESLGSIVVEVRNTTDSIGTAAREVAAGNSDLSQRTEEQASSLEETASSMEELTSTVKQNAENAKHANQLAAAASDIAVKGGQAVGEVVQTMASISTSSKKIVDIISVIEGIAFQTNILALNAAVEAARAGEQGRGFAVVAAEVRNLAQRSAAAAKEIKTLIGDSVGKVDAGSKQVDQAGATMSEIVTAVKRVTDIMAEIAAASDEQSEGIEQVNQAIIQMDEVTQQNAALVEQAAAAAESMQGQANALFVAVSVFKLEVGKGGTRTVAAKPIAKSVIAPPATPAKAALRKQRKLIKSNENKDGDWKEF